MFVKLCQYTVVIMLIFVNYAHFQKSAPGLMLFKSVAYGMYSISGSILAPSLKLAPTLNNHPPYKQES